MVWVLAEEGPARKCMTTFFILSLSLPLYPVLAALLLVLIWLVLGFAVLIVSTFGPAALGLLGLMQLWEVMGERGHGGEGEDVPDAKTQQRSGRHHLLGASLRLADWHPKLLQLRRAGLCFDDPEVTAGDSFRCAPLCLRVSVPVAGPGPLWLPTFLLLLCYLLRRASGGKPGTSIHFGAPLPGLLCEGSEGTGCACP